jgi:localization factor PodJL
MMHVPRHVKGVRPAVRAAAGDAARRPGFPVGAAVAAIRRDIQELRRQTLRSRVEPAALERRLHELATQIGVLQGAAPGAGLDAFLWQLKALLAENIAALQQHVATSAAAAISGPAESIRRDVASLKEIQASVDRRTQGTFEAVYGTIERIVDRLAAIEDELRERSYVPQADASTPSADEREWPRVRTVPSGPAAAAPALMPADWSAGTAVLRQPAVPDLQFDAAPRQESVKPDVECRRSQPFAPIGVGLAAVRSAAHALAGAFRAAQDVPAAMVVRTTLWPARKTAVLSIGAGLLMLFAFTLALDFYRSPADPAPDAFPVAETGAGADRAGDGQATASNPPQPRQEASLNPGPALVPFDVDPPVDDSRPVAAAAAAEMVAAAALSTPMDATRNPDFLMRNVLVQSPASRNPWEQSPSDPTLEPLPPAIGSKALVAAATAGDPAASYEVGIRFAQGHNAAPDFVKAAAWLERAARGDLAPAQFLLATMYEKGLGVRKDPAEARRLYLVAAAKGHVRAMHNVAVLYAGGIDGSPDYGAAADWFRKAALYGAVDSQYNLGILYARGTGVERDLAESYEWFGLAAKSGDKDAARKRDEVARGLDTEQLENARASVEAFVAAPQPDEATVVKAPAGGWNRVATAATTKSRTLVRPERFPGR